MKQSRRWQERLGVRVVYWATLSTFAVQAAWADGPAGQIAQIPQNSMMAASPMTDYTIAAIAYVLVIGFLVSTLLIGAFLLLNLGLMSKRKEDRIGGRTPSDVGILKGTNWPNEDEQRPVLPAEDWEGNHEVLHQDHEDRPAA